MLPKQLSTKEDQNVFQTVKAPFGAMGAATKVFGALEDICTY